MTHNRLVGFSGLAAGVMLLTVACGGGGADPSTTQAHIREHVPRLIGDTLGAFEGVGDSATFSSIADSLSTLDGAYDLPFALGEETDTITYSLRQAVEEEEDPGEAAARFLADQIFIDANYEGDGVYRIPPELFCETEEGTDPDCVQAVNAAQIKIRAEEAGDGVDLTLLIGPDRDEPLSVELRSNSLALVVDFGETRAAIVALADLFGEDADSLELPDVWTGVVALTLTRHAEQDVSVAFAVREAVVVEAETDSGRIAFSTAAKDPALLVRASGIAHTLELALDIGRTQLSLPFDMIEDYAAGQTFAIDWAGLSGRVVLSESDSLELTNIGFGDATSEVTLDGERIFALDLNPQHGRRFGLTISPTDTFPRFDLDPAFDLSMAFRLQTLVDAGAYAPDIESFLLDETYRVALTGTDPAVQADADAGGGHGGLAILSGSLSLSSTAAASPVVVDAGQCLVGQALSGPSEHPVLGHLTSGDCQ